MQDNIINMPGESQTLITEQSKVSICACKT